jgi:hypothetical protein
MVLEMIQQGQGQVGSRGARNQSGHDNLFFAVPRKRAPIRWISSAGFNTARWIFPGLWTAPEIFCMKESAYPMPNPNELA